MYAIYSFFRSFGYTKLTVWPIVSGRVLSYPTVPVRGSTFVWNLVLESMWTCKYHEWTDATVKSKYFSFCYISSSFGHQWRAARLPPSGPNATDVLLFDLFNSVIGTAVVVVISSVDHVVVVVVVVESCERPNVRVRILSADLGQPRRR